MFDGKCKKLNKIDFLYMFLVHIWFAICLLVFFSKKKITFFQNTHPANDINPAQVLVAGI